MLAVSLCCETLCVMHGGATITTCLRENLMGQHRTSTSHRPTRPSKRGGKIPPFPDNKGRKTGWRSIRGVRRRVKIEDQIHHLQSGTKNKLIVLQKLQYEGMKTFELRLGYYMIGVRPRMKGKWTWGQFAAIIPPKDFRAIVKSAQKRKWI